MVFSLMLSSMLKFIYYGKMRYVDEDSPMSL